MQTSEASLEVILIFLMIITVLWVIVLMASMTRTQRFGRISTALTILAAFAACGGAFNLGLELFWTLLQRSGYPNPTTLLISALLLSIGIPSLYVLKSADTYEAIEHTFSQYFDLAANNAFTVGITLQVIILTLFTSGVIVMEDTIYLLSLSVIVQLSLYVLSFFYHIRKQKNDSIPTTHPIDQD